MTAVLVVLILLALLVGVLLGLWLARSRRDGTPEPPEPPETEPPHSIPSRLDPGALTSALVPRLAGRPADGSPASGAPPSSIVWVDGSDEVVVHLDSLESRIVDGTLVVSLELESVETGRAPLIVVLALGSADDPAGLVATTNELPRGNTALAARWGNAVQTAVWSSLIALAHDHADERDHAPRGLSIDGNTLRLHAGEPLVLTSGTS